PAGMTTIGLSYSLVKISTKCAPALPSNATHHNPEKFPFFAPCQMAFIFIHCRYPVSPLEMTRRTIMSNNKKPMTPEAVSRIQSAEARTNGGGVSKDSFTARAQKTVAVPPLKPTTK
ncbi:hypothetical protein, partial [Aeromonas veronii]|uniref:hypothetical protein n=2 Tax=Aeromonadaceae TaxID=84642 RepID=UPI003D1C263E